MSCIVFIYIYEIKKKKNIGKKWFKKIINKTKKSMKAGLSIYSVDVNSV